MDLIATKPQITGWMLESTKYKEWPLLPEHLSCVTEFHHGSAQHQDHRVQVGEVAVVAQDAQHVTVLFYRLYNQYLYMMDHLRDERADSLPLMSSIWPTITICLGYVYFIKVAGPRSVITSGRRKYWMFSLQCLPSLTWLQRCWSTRFMRERRPYELKYFVRVYNLLQTCLSFWGFTEGWK